MRSKTVRTVAWVLGVVIVIWATAGAAVLYVRSGCTPDFPPRCAAGLANWIGDALTLGWLYHFQTLVSGALALSGAALVLVAARLQLDAADRERRALKDERARVALLMMSAAFSSAAHAFERGEGSNGELTATVNRHIGDVIGHEPGFAEIMMLLAARIEAGLRQFTSRGDIEQQPDDVREAMAYALVMRDYFGAIVAHVTRAKDSPFPLPVVDWDDISGILGVWGNLGQHDLYLLDNLVSD